MPKAFDDMRKKIAAEYRGKTNPRTKKPYSESDIYAIAVSSWEKSHGGKAPKREMLATMTNEMENFNIIEYTVPITVEQSVTEGMIFRGTAIDETISRNGVKYEAEELQKAAASLNGRPLLNSHRSDDIKDILGRVKNSTYNAEKRSIEFEADVMDETAAKMIRDGRIQNVSVGAKAGRFVEEDDGNGVMCKAAKDIEFLELSLVAVPGVPHASINQSFTQALQEKFDFLTEADDELTYIMEESNMEKNDTASLELQKIKDLEESHKLVVEKMTEAEKAMKSEKEKLEKELAAYKTKERETLVTKVIEAEKKAKMIKDDKEEKDEKESLMGLSDEAIGAILKRFEKFPAESQASVKDEESSGKKGKVFDPDTNKEESVDKHKYVVEKFGGSTSIYRVN